MLYVNNVMELVENWEKHINAQNVKEDKNDDVVGNAGWVLNDAVSNQENDSDILEAVAGQKEANSGSLNGISPALWR